MPCFLEKKNRWHFPPFNLRGKMIWEVFPFMVWYTIDFILFGMLVWKFYKIKKITQEWNIVKIENKLHLKLITMSQLSTICATKWSASVIQIYQHRINQSIYNKMHIKDISLEAITFFHLNQFSSNITSIFFFQQVRVIYLWKIPALLQNRMQRIFGK